MSHDHCQIAECHNLATFRVRASADMDGARRGLGRSAMSLRVCSGHVRVALGDCASQAAEAIRVQGYIHGNPISMAG